MPQTQTLTPPATRHRFQTVANLLEYLGGIPPERVWFDPPPGFATEQDVVEIHDRTNRLCELIDGILVEKAMGFWEARVAVVLGYLIQTWLEEHDLGIVVGADGMMRLSGGRVRMPDVSFLAWDQFPDRQIPREPIPDLFPDLAVEVLSASNTPGEMKLKRRDYFASGCRLVWEIDPDARTVAVFTGPDESQTFGEHDEIDGRDVLPGFRFTLRELLDQSGGQR